MKEKGDTEEENHAMSLRSTYSAGRNGAQGYRFDFPHSITVLPSPCYNPRPYCAPRLKHRSDEPTETRNPKIRYRGRPKA